MSNYTSGTNPLDLNLEPVCLKQKVSCESISKHYFTSYQYLRRIRGKNIKSMFQSNTNMACLVWQLVGMPAMMVSTATRL